MINEAITMDPIKQNLYITFSNQKVRALKRGGLLQSFDKVTTLSQLILDLFEQTHFETLIDNTLGSTIVAHMVKSASVDYFGYLNEGDDSFSIIFDFIVKCHRNGVAFETLLSGDKLQALHDIDLAYQVFKERHALVDIADVEKRVLEQWHLVDLSLYENVYLDTFKVGGIDFCDSKTEEALLRKIKIRSKPMPKLTSYHKAKLIKPQRAVFDTIDEIKTALKIVRKLLEAGTVSSEILIVASDIAEYATLYKLFLSEYGLQGYSSIGTPLSSFHNKADPKVTHAMKQYEAQLSATKMHYKRLGLRLSTATQEKLMTSHKILDEKIGIEMTEPNQLVGLDKSYQHIIFIGTDINHFPPSASDNFLYSYEDDLAYFYANNYFTSSQTQLDELKRLSEHLYIITATYSGKRELTPSILLDGSFDETIDLSAIKSISELALERQTVHPDQQTQAYYESITSEKLTNFDGKGVAGIKAKHLSASQINRYLSCPLSYLYSNKVRLQAPNQSDEGFDVMEQGSLMHLCYELFGQKIKETKSRSVDQEALYALMYESSIEAYYHQDTIAPRGKEKLVENIHHKIFLSTLQAGLKDDRDAGLLAKFVDYYREHAAAFEYFQNTEFEREFALDDALKPYVLKSRDDKNYFIKGFIDRFDNLEKQINVIDYKSKKISNKSGKHKETQEKIEGLKDVQLALYILYAKQQYPAKAYYASMLSFKGDSKAAHFGELKHEMFSESYEEELKSIIYHTKESIEKGAFGFDNSDETACGWCDYRFICHESVLNKGLN